MGRKAGTPQSRKAKGRRAACEVKELLLLFAPSLMDDDIHVTSSSVTGEDLSFSPVGRQTYNLSIEVKCQEGLNIWKALLQAESHCKDDLTRIPTLFFKRNNSKMYVALEADKFLSIFRQWREVL